MSYRSATRLPCPSCGAPLVRVRRQPADRAPGLSAMRRYRCRAAACGFGGLLVRNGALTAAPLATPAIAHAQPGRPGPRAWLMSVLALSLGLAFASAAGLLVLRSGWAPLDHRAHAGGVQRLPPGGQFDGVPLPGLRRVAMAPDQDVPAEAAGSRTPRRAGDAVDDDPSELALRQHCVWGQPGRSPYKGTPEQALRAGRVPADLVPVLAARIRARQVSDRVAIRREGIRTAQDGREFSPRGLALSFGRSMCLDSRVNFKPGHVEQADFYEVRDARGQAHRVIVPDVCGNVSVLSAGGERGPVRRLVAGAAGWLIDTLAAAPQPDDEGYRVSQAIAQNDTVQQVPEPAGWACVLAGLVALGWVRRISTRA